MSNKIGLKTKNIIPAGAVAVLVVAGIMNLVPLAAALDQIQTTHEASSPLDKVWNIISNDKVWNIISNVSNDPKYWSQIHSVNIISKAGNTIQADMTLGPYSAKGHEIVVMHPKQLVTANITQGPITGTRTVTKSTVRKQHKN